MVLLLGGPAFAVERAITFQDGVAPDVTYSGTRDISLSSAPADPQEDPDTNYDVIRMRADGFEAVHQVLFRWDVSGAGIGTVESVRVAFYIYDSSPQTYPLHELLRAWSEPTVTWNQASTGVPWGLPGARGEGTDRKGETVGELFYPHPSGGTASLNLNAAGVAMVQRWVSFPAQNFGFVVDNEWAPDGISITSKENLIGTNRPMLEITHDGGLVTRFAQGLFPGFAYAGAQDAMICTARLSAAGNLNGQGLWLGLNINAMWSFDVSAIPPGANVLRAELDFQMGTLGSVRDIHEALQPWTEAATWATFDGTNAWGAPGGTLSGSDFAPEVLGQIGPAAPPGPFTAPLNAAGVAAVQAWVDGTRPNHGFTIPVGTGNASMILDRERASPSERPALTVVYEDGVDGGEAGDGGHVTPDGGSPTTHASLDPRAHLTVACGCGSTPGVPGALGWVLLLAAGLGARRGRAHAEADRCPSPATEQPVSALEERVRLL